MFDLADDVASKEWSIEHQPALDAPISLFSRALTFTAWCFVLAVPPANAQRSGTVYLGVHGAYNFNDFNAAAIGVHAVVGLPLRLAVYPSATYYMLTPGSLWLVAPTIRWAPLQTRFRPYVGVGPYWSSANSNLTTTTDVGLVTQVGVELGTTGWQSFAELQILKDGAVSAVVAAGLRLRVRHSEPES